MAFMCPVGVVSTVSWTGSGLRVRRCSCRRPGLRGCWAQGAADAADPGSNPRLVDVPGGALPPHLLAGGDAYLVCSEVTVVVGVPLRSDVGCSARSFRPHL